MNIRITSRHFKLSAKIKEYVEEKIGRLDRYFDRIIDCEVILKKEKMRQTVETNIKVYGSVLHVKTTDQDPTKAIDMAVDKLEAQLKKFKSKMQDRPHVRMRDVLEVAPAAADE